jgi:uncharacterized membrane protein
MQNHNKTRIIAGAAILTAIVIVLQLIGGAIHFGVFSISLVLVPIVIGAALYGVWIGAWLGLVFGVMVLLTGDAAPFLAINPLGTVLTVLIKGTCAGLCAGLVYRALEKKNQFAAVVCAAITAPVVNTGLFLVGCVLFFLDAVTEWGKAAGFENVGTYMITGFVGLNFLFELLVNVILAPVIVRLVNLGRKTQK